MNQLLTGHLSPNRLSERKHLGHVDALRGIAVVGVILVHTAMLTQQRGTAFDFGFTGQRGVQLFYVLSAFTLCLSLDSPRKEHRPLTNFFIRRFFRIAPLFYLAIIANLLVNVWAPARSSLHDLSRLDILLGFLFLNGLRPEAINSVAIGGWSIAVETTFYILLPFLHGRFKSVRQILTLLMISAPILFFISSRLSLAAGENIVLEQYFAFLWFPVEFPVFVIGLLTYAIWKKYIAVNTRSSKEWREASVLLLLFSCVLYCACFPFNDRNLYFSSFLFLPLILSLSIYPWKIFVNTFTRFLGKISYSLYLCHFFVLGFVGWILSRLDRQPDHLVSRYIMGHWIGYALAFVAVLVISIPLCVLTWMFIERPGIGLGRYLIDNLEGRNAARPVTSSVPVLSEWADPRSTPDAQF